MKTKTYNVYSFAELSDKAKQTAIDECAGFYSVENFAEHCEANDYQFTEDGRID